MNKQSDLIFLKTLQDAITSLDQLDELIATNGERQSKVDCELSDLLHIFEDETAEITESASVKLCTRIRELRLERKALRNEYELISKYQDIKGQLINKNNRQFLIAEIQKRMKTLNCPYKNRVLTTDEVNNILQDEKPTEEKTRRSRRGKITDEQIKELLNKGYSQSRISKELGVSQPSVSLRIKKMKGNDDL